jgi:hypothetical protein
MPTTAIRKADSASGFLHTPLEDHRAVDHVFEVFAVGGPRFPLSRGNIGHDLESALLDRGGDFLTGFGVGCPHPLTSQGFELVVLRPAEPRGIAIGSQRLVQGRVQHIGAEPARAKEIPAALVDGLFRSSANGKISPVASRNLHRESEPP